MMIKEANRVFLTFILLCRAFLSLFAFVPREPVGHSFNGIHSLPPNRATLNPRRYAAATDATDVLVIGAGLSGCATSFYLNCKGLNVKMVDSNNYVGGNLVSKEKNGYLWEEGPNSFQSSPSMLRFISDIGLKKDIIFAEGESPRYIFNNKKLHRLPGGMGDFLSTDFFTATEKLRLVSGILGFIDEKPPKEESIEQFASRHFGPEVFRKLIDPFVSGVYAGDPKALSMQTALRKVQVLEELGVSRGLLDGALVKVMESLIDSSGTYEMNADLPKVSSAALGTLRMGLQGMALKVQNILGGGRIMLSHRLAAVRKEGQSWVSSLTNVNTGQITDIRSNAVVLTAPAKQTASILLDSLAQKASGADVSAFKAAESIVYPPIASVILAYPTASMNVQPLNGFGHLVPRSEGIKTLGSIWASSLFPNRAPAGMSTLVNFIGGTSHPEVASMSPSQLVQQVHDDNSQILLKPGTPVPTNDEVLAVRLWPQAVPQYNKGHSAVVSNYQRAVQRQGPGLFVGGNYLTGVSLPDCVSAGKAMAENVYKYIMSKQ